VSIMYKIKLLLDWILWLVLNVKQVMVNTRNVSATKIVDSYSIQRTETKYGLRIQFLALVVTIHEVWLNA